MTTRYKNFIIKSTNIKDKYKFGELYQQHFNNIIDITKVIQHHEKKDIYFTHYYQLHDRQYVQNLGYKFFRRVIVGCSNGGMYLLQKVNINKQCKRITLKNYKINNIIITKHLENEIVKKIIKLALILTEKGNVYPIDKKEDIYTIGPVLFRKIKDMIHDNYNVIFVAENGNVYHGCYDNYNSYKSNDRYNINPSQHRHLSNIIKIKKGYLYLNLTIYGYLSKSKKLYFLLENLETRKMEKRVVKDIDDFMIGSGHIIVKKLDGLFYITHDIRKNVWKKLNKNVIEYKGNESHTVMVTDKKTYIYNTQTNPMLIFCEEDIVKQRIKKISKEIIGIKVINDERNCNYKYTMLYDKFGNCWGCDYGKQKIYHIPNLSIFKILNTLLQLCTRHILLNQKKYKKYIPLLPQDLRKLL